MSEDVIIDLSAARSYSMALGGDELRAEKPCKLPERFILCDPKWPSTGANPKFKQICCHSVVLTTCVPRLGKTELTLTLILLYS